MGTIGDGSKWYIIPVRRLVSLSRPGLNRPGRIQVVH